MLGVGSVGTPRAELEDRTRRWAAGYTIIGLGGIAAAFIVGFVLPLPYRIATFHPWLTGDWLIDYSSGFVRRGLAGTLLTALTSDAVDAIRLVALVQFGLAASLFVLVGTLFWRTSREPVWIMLVLSPAFLLFPVLDPDASARKEIIALVALAILALGVSLQRTHAAALIALPVFALAAFSHEASLVTLPAALFLLVSGWTSTKSKLYVLLSVYGALTALATGIGLLFPGNARLVDDMCTRWLQRGVPQCDGALAALGQPISQIQSYLFMELFPGYWGYLIPAALALIPLFLVRFLPGQWVITLVVVGSAAPLFLVAWDYGRWIYLITAQLSLIALALARTGRFQPMRVPLIAAMTFILLWGVEHVSQPLTPGALLRWFQ